MGTKNMTRKMSATMCALAFSCSAITVSAQDNSKPQYYDIERQDLESALRTFAMAADLEVLYAPDLVKNKDGVALKGNYTYGQALALLLNKNGLSYQFTDAKTLLIKPDIKSQGSAENQKKSVNQDDISRNNMMEEITVTATKRASNIQDSPMAISALGSETIEKRGLVSMGDYLSTIPGVTMQDRGAGANSMVIRGIGSDPQRGRSATGVYFGEIPLAGMNRAEYQPDRQRQGL